MGIVIEMKSPYKNFIKKWKHRLFECPTWWKSKWNTFWKSKPAYRCPGCKKAMHCYWDGNDVAGRGIDYCNDCVRKIELSISRKKQKIKYD